MQPNQCVLGIDIGSVAVGLVVLNPQKEIQHKGYAVHRGQPDACLKELLASIALESIASIAVTAATPEHVHRDLTVDNQIAVMTTARHLHPDVGTILMVGGEKFYLIRYDAAGNYLGTRTNTACAAGTGSFLDQQAGRLNLGGIQELSQVAAQNQDHRPQIATRCAVFAKTDLIHAQQEGFRLDQICDGLCQGLAKNIGDTLLGSERLTPPLLACGGVARNETVIGHLSRLLKAPLQVDDLAHLYGAMGAALERVDACNTTASIQQSPQIVSPEAVVRPRETTKQYFYPPLTLVLSRFPSFDGLQHYDYEIKSNASSKMVEVDVYEPLTSDSALETWLGIDVGSTSTKAVLMDQHKTVLAGFYTRTAGQPVAALQHLFESINDLMQRHAIQLTVLGSATTGSGRKFVGRLINAELMLDEITAHARAAWELNPAVDTIIEIGGQDAKFTTLQNGGVTYSVMNNVCAAGTGSFIEEQALKLNCPLTAYSARTENMRAPISSDRCTVFMERDINHYLSEGYAVEEVLASVLHSVRENYLLKVAVEARIGTNILFQGATAKNKALVAAFEQRLNQPIQVSRFCHLTGAMGCALTLMDEQAVKGRPQPSRQFRGIDLYRHQIPIRSEVCQLCTNHCKITVAQVPGQTVAFGFLCGRDYDTQKRVGRKNNTFDLLKARKQAFVRNPRINPSGPITIGLPAAVHLIDDLPLWQRFFDLLAIPTITSEGYKTAVKTGKGLAGAEFCTPMAAMHGHVHYLLEKAAHVFIPFYLDHPSSKKEKRRQYCYYTQYLPVLMSQMAGTMENVQESRIVSPLLRYLYTGFHTKKELYRTLHPLTGKTFLEISMAYDRAVSFKREGFKTLRAQFKRVTQNSRDINVVFLGRPYTVLDPTMNHGIPGILRELGINSFYQDMLSYSASDVSDIAPLLKEIHWHFAARILEAAQVVARSEGLYPVLLTAFKCAPDSFAADYFRKIMDAHNKPYLILELDEHDSSVGYETRVEAAVRTFRTHHSRSPMPVMPRYRNLNPDLNHAIGQRTIVVPNWDRITGTFLTANLRREGYRAVLMEETPETIQESQKFNTGQCIPMNAIAQGYIHTIQKHNLDPAQTLLWFSKSTVACNIKLYPHHIKTILNNFGGRFEKAGVYVGNLTFIDVSIKAAINAYFAYMFGGLIRKVGCNIRPYEVQKGQTDRVLEESIRIIYDAFLGSQTKEAALDRIMPLFEAIPTQVTRRPKVAIFGDLYSRDNAVLNQNLIRFIETQGGEVVTTPYSQIAKMVAGTYFKKWFNEGNYLNLISNKTMLAAVTHMERTYYKYFERVLHEPDAQFDDPPEKILARYGLRIENTGESMDNILKVHYLKKHYPDLCLYVLAAPALCCPSLITEAMARQIETNTGVPVVTVTYDGTGGSKNEAIVPYLKYPRTTGVQQRQRFQPTG